jgi:hypothetical protein
MKTQNVFGGQFLLLAMRKQKMVELNFCVLKFDDK